MAVRVAVLDDYQDVARSMVDWQQLGQVEVTFIHKHLDDQELMARLRGYPIVVAMRERTRFTRRLLEGLPDLRLLATMGLKNAAIDLAAARDRGVVVCGTNALGYGATELTWGLILALVRHIPTEDATIRTGGWQATIGTCLRGRRLGVVGLGKQGAGVARIGRAFGMDVCAWSPHLTAVRAAEQQVRLLGKEELFRTSDIVTIHMVLGPTTKGLVGAAELRAMRPDAYLVNTSRGPLVDQTSLRTALEERWIAGAALDVYDQEPLPAKHPLRQAPRTVLTPHLGYVTVEQYQLYFREIVEDIRAYLAGEPIRILTAHA